MAKIVAQREMVYIFVSETFSQIHKEELNSQYSAQMDLMAVTNSAKIWKRLNWPTTPVSQKSGGFFQAWNLD